MTYRFVEHTADMGIEVEATSFEELLAESLVALTDSLTDVTDVRALMERGVSLEAASREELLVDWLNELVFLFEVESMLFRRAELAIAERAGGWRLRRTDPRTAAPSPHRRPVPSACQRRIAHHHGPGRSRMRRDDRHP